MSSVARLVRVDARITDSLRPQRGRLLLAGLLGALTLACSITLLATSGWLISRASQMPPVLSLSIAIVTVRACGIGRGVFRYLERLVSHDAAFRTLTGLRVQIYERLEQLAPTGLAAFRRGDLLSRNVADVDAMQDLPLRVLLPWLTAAITGTAAVAVTWWLLPAAGAVLLVALLVGGFVVPAITVAAGARAARTTATARGDLSAVVTELLNGASDLVALGAAPAALARTVASDAALTRLSRTSAGALGLAAGLGVLTSGIAVLGALVAGIPAVRDGRLDGVALAVVVLLPLAAYEAVTSLPAAGLALVGVRASAQRLIDVIDTPLPVHEPVAPAPAPSPSARHRVVLRDLTVRWPGAGTDALAGLDLDLAPGRRIAVVGSSGAGKSTTASALLRFVEYTGSVRIDDVELRNLRGEDVRRIIGICAQDAHVFDTTLAANLRVAAPEATDGELRAVLDRVQLLAWVDGLPRGWDTAVGEHGSRMSGGQRQRLALARTLLADPPVVVFDEPTEHLDTDTADALTRDLLALTRGRTTLLITHRLLGLEGVDEIVVLEAGHVVERGTHVELLALNGTYADRHARELAL